MWNFKFKRVNYFAMYVNVSLYGARFTKLTREHSKHFKGTELSDDNTII